MKDIKIRHQDTTLSKQYPCKCLSDCQAVLFSVTETNRKIKNIQEINAYFYQLHFNLLNPIFIFYIRCTFK